MHVLVDTIKKCMPILIMFLMTKRIYNKSHDTILPKKYIPRKF